MSKLQTAALIVLFLWNLLLFQWFAGQLSDVRKTISELNSLKQREGDTIRLNRLPYENNNNNNNAVNSNNNNNNKIGKYTVFVSLFFFVRYLTGLKKT